MAGLWIDGGRIGGPVAPTGSGPSHQYGWADCEKEKYWPGSSGRFPANIILDEEAAAALDEQSGTLKSGLMKADTRRSTGGGYMGHFPGEATDKDTPGDSGGASRFFYTAKASPSERGKDNKHPTVKPLALMRYLVRFTKTPKGGIVLDPFCGSGSTLIACVQEGRDYIGVDEDAGAVRIAEMRLANHTPKQMSLW